MKTIKSSKDKVRPAKCLLILATMIVALVSTSGLVAGQTGSLVKITGPGDKGRIDICNTLICINLNTDKSQYNDHFGAAPKNVIFTVKNLYKTQSIWIDSRPVKIVNVNTGQVVYEPTTCRGCDDLRHPKKLELKPGQSYNWTWNQRMSPCVGMCYVGAGAYRGELVNNYATSNTFSIQRENGVLQGHVTIGPLCPVGPCRMSSEQMKKVYESRKIIIYDANRQSVLDEVNIDENGAYRIGLNSGKYVVDINRIGVDNSAGLPKEINIKSGKTVVLDISIDTGIR